MVVRHETSPKTHFLAALTARHRRVLQTREQLVKQFSCAGRFTLRFRHSFHCVL